MRTLDFSAFLPRNLGLPERLVLGEKGVDDREAAKQSRGLGLLSMEERLKLLKGTLSIESQPKRGTTIHARVPLRGTDSMRAAG